MRAAVTVPEPAFHETIARVGDPWERVDRGYMGRNFWDRLEPEGTLRWWDFEHWAAMAPFTIRARADWELLNGDLMSVWELAAAAKYCSADTDLTDTVLEAVAALEDHRDREVILYYHWCSETTSTRQLMAMWRLCPGWHLRSFILTHSDAPLRMLEALSAAADDTDYRPHRGITPIRTIPSLVSAALIGRAA